MIDFVQVVDLVSRGGLVAALLIAIWGGMKEWYVWRGSHQQIVNRLEQDLVDMTKDRDYWRNQAVQALTTANRAVHARNTITEAE